MKRLDLDIEAISLSELLSIAKNEPLLLLLPSGEEFILKLYSDEDEEFALEVETLRNSKAFQTFLERRLNYKKKRPIEEVLAKVETELSSFEK